MPLGQGSVLVVVIVKGKVHQFGFGALHSPALLSQEASQLASNSALQSTACRMEMGETLHFVLHCVTSSWSAETAIKKKQKRPIITPCLSDVASPWTGPSVVAPQSQHDL